MTILRLQSGAGNAAVGRALAGAAPAGSLGPLGAQLEGARKAFSTHPGGGHEARAAQAAAHPPADGRLAKANEARAATMGAAPVAPFDKTAFVKAVDEHIAAAAPKSGDEAVAMAASGTAVAMPPGVVGELARGKDVAAKPLSEAAAAEPDLAKAGEKPVRDLPEPPAPPNPGIDPGAAVPPAVPAKRLDFAAGPHRLETEMAAHDLTDDQLAAANEPQFSAALKAKQAVAEHAAAEPGALRDREKEHRGAVHGAAQAAVGGALAVLGGQRARGRSAVRGHQQSAKARDEAVRAEVSAHVNDLFGATKRDVEKILTNLGDTVPRMFASLETIARLNFTFDYRGHLAAYKDERHSSWFGWARAIGDEVTGLPKEVEGIYEAAKQRYLQVLRNTVSDIADFVARELTRAKQRVADGRAEISTYVAGLSPKLREVGVEASIDIDAQFDDLDANINDTVVDLASEVGQRYAEGVAAVDSDIAQSREEEQGLLADAGEFLAGVWNTIGDLKDLLLTVFDRFVHAVGAIIKHPIRFFKTYILSITDGVTQFVGNLGTALADGLKTWLFGKLPAGVELPDEFDAVGLIKLALSLLGYGWERLKQSVIGLVPEPLRDEMFAWLQTLVSGGPAALIEFVGQELGGVADTIWDKIIEFVQSTVITAAMDKVGTLLGGPAGAFIETCKLVYRAFKWLAANLDSLRELVMAFLSGVDEAAESEEEKALPGVAAKVKGMLTAAIPVLIDGLANLLGLGDIAPRVHALIDAVRRPVKSVVDKIVRGAQRFAKSLLRKLSGSRLGRFGAAVADKLTAARRALNRVLARRIPISNGRHHVYTEVHGAEATLMVASTPEKVLARIGNALAIPAARSNARLVETLERLRTRVESYQTGVREAEKSNAKEVIKAAELKLYDEAVNISRDLDDLEKRHPVLTQGGTVWTTPDGKLKDKYLKKVRRIFYRFGYRQHTGRLLTDAHDEKRRRVAQFGTNPMYPKASYYCPGFDNDPAHLAYDRLGVQADHLDPVTAHWEGQGRRTTQADREHWDTDITNLIAMCPYHNRKKGSGGEHFNPQTEPGFDGPP